MTNRDMSPTLVTATEQAVVQYYELIEILVGDGYYLTNAQHDISYGGNTYIAAGALLGFDSVEENIGFEIEKLTINIGGIEPLPGDSEPFIKKILGLDYVDREVRIRRAYYNVKGDYVDQVLLYSGYISSANAASALGDQGAAVSIETSNNWTDFTRRNGRFTNLTSQQAHFPSDLGFEYAVQVQKQVEWKEA